MSTDKVTLRAGRDSYVNHDKPNANFRGSTRLFVRADGGDHGRYSYIYFAVNIPKKATVTKAVLRLTEASNIAGDSNISVTRLSEKFENSKVTWANRPGVTGGSVDGDKVGSNTWTFDVQDHMQAVANGTIFKGWRIETSANTIYEFKSSEASTGKPTLEIEWDEAPVPPTDLNPGGGGFVMTGSPVLSWDFRDNRGATGMGGYQVQVFTADDLTGKILDKTVASTVPAHDLSTDVSWTALTDETPVYWRVKVKDTRNNWSDWSDLTSFAYEAMGTLTISAPSGTVVNDPSPTVAWSLTGQDQSMWQVLVRSETDREIYDSGRRASVDEAWTIPKNYIKSKGASYTIVVRVWDDVDRASTTGGDVMYEATKTVTYTPGTGTAPTDLTATDLNEPGIELTWAYSGTADRFDIWRDDELVESVDPGDANTGTPGEFYYVDYGAKIGESYTYAVGASVNGEAVESAEVTKAKTNTFHGIWLIDRNREIKVQILGDDAGDWNMGEVSETYAPVNGTHSRLITQALRGFEGSISGLLITHGGRTVEQQEADMFELKATPGQTYVLVASDLAIPVVIRNVVVAPTPQPETTKAVSFEFYQVGDLPFRGTL